MPQALDLTEPSCIPMLKNANITDSLQSYPPASELLAVCFMCSYTHLYKYTDTNIHPHRQDMHIQHT